MVAALKIFGKKELSQLNPIDIILILLISNAVQNAMVTVDDYQSLKQGLVAALVLFVINFIFKKFLNRSKTINDWIGDKPEILIHDGKIDLHALEKLGITKDEMDEAIREHGLDSFKEVKLAMLEMDGNISIISENKTIRQTKHKRRIHKTLGAINN